MSFTTELDIVKQALRFGFPVACNAALMFLAMQGDRVLIAIYFEPEVLAAFALAAQLTLLPALAGAKYLLTFDLPRFSRLTLRPNAWQSLFRSRLRRVAGIAATLALMLGILGDELVGFLYGPQFVVDPAVMGLLALAAGLNDCPAGVQPATHRDAVPGLWRARNRRRAGNRRFHRCA
jgi:O-antigen/teichoic acid export membrane protein